MIDFFCIKKVEGLSRLQGKPMERMDETWYVGGVVIVGVYFSDLKGMQKKTTAMLHKTQPVSK